MKFRNISGKDLDFTIDKARFTAGVGELLEIPDEIAYCVALHGLPLKQHDAPAPVVAADEPKAAPKQKASKNEG